MTEPVGESQVTRRGEAWSEVAGVGGATFRLRLGGLFRTAWMGALCNRLAHHRISVDHVHARLTRGDTWIAELHVITLEGAADPLRLPYVELTEAEDAPAAAVLSLDRYHLVESHDHGGTLMLTLEAEDSLGLLGSLLALLASLTLFPIEVHIETRDGRAYDSLWLASDNGTAPSTQAREALASALASAVRPPAP